MTGTQSKIRALFLAGLMVLSVFAATMAFSGSAAAFTHNRGATGTWDTTDGEGNVGNNAVVFQGEGDIEFWNSGTQISASSLTNGDGVALGMPIPDDRAEGNYNGGTPSTSITLSNPDITDYEFRSGGPSGADIAGGTVSASQNTLSVWVEYNYAEAEDIELEVTDSNDNDWTDTVVTSSNPASGLSSTPNDEVEFTLDLSELDTGEEYTVSMAGSDDLDSGDAQVSDTFEISADDDPTLNLDDEEIIQGQDASYEVTGAVEGDYHVVTISTNDVVSNADSVFRNVNDVEEVDATSDYAYAVVEIDGGTGDGLINTQYLDTTDVTVELRGTTDPDTAPSPLTSVPSTVEDDQDLTVNEGSVTLENPTNIYVPGSEVTVNGTASEGISEVTLYARDQAEYQRVDVNGNTMSVSGGEFEVEDVRLSRSGAQSGNDILSYPGNYRIALVQGNPGATMTTTNVAQNVSDTHTLRVAEGEMDATVSIVNGQVAVGDQIDVSGVAEGSDEINVTFFGPRGTVDSVAPISVDTDSTFEQENIGVGGHLNSRFSPAFSSSISEGTVIMSVLTNGRDDVRGDGTPPTATGPVATDDTFGQLVYNINNGQYTQQQAIDRLSSQTTDDTGSDDVSQTFQFRFTDPRTTVDNAVGEAGVNGTVQIGSEMTVAGTTNRQPEDNSITVEVIEGPSQTDFDVATTDEWPLTGNWNVTLDTEGLQPGTYTVEASDGSSSDILQFSLQEDSPDPGEDTTTEPDTTTADPGTETTEPDDTDTTTTTDGQDGPGFTFVAALVGLLAAALLAVRRHS